jgi:hypothetical protein
MFFDCPKYLDREGSVRCGLPAEVRCRSTMRSSDGHLKSVMIRCPASNWFNGPIESLTWERTDQHGPGTTATAPGATHASSAGGDDGRAGTGRSVIHDASQPGQAIRRPNTAAAYYLGRPASLWTTATSPISRPRSWKGTAAQPSEQEEHSTAAQPQTGTAASQTAPASGSQDPRSWALNWGNISGRCWVRSRSSRTLHRNR